MRIDFHTHLFPDKLSGKALGKLAAVCGLTPQTDGTLAGTLKKLDRWQIDRAVTLHIATAPGQEHNVNAFASSVVKATGGRLLAFGSVHPDSPDALEILGGFRELGLSGVKLHPDYQGFEADERRLYPIYAHCSELKLPCCLHMGFDPLSPAHFHATPAMLARVIRDFPHLTLVLAHMGGMRLWDEVEEHLIGKRVYLDTAMVAGELSPEKAARMIQKHGAEQVLLGSDCPWQDSETAACFVQSLAISEEEKEKILWRNAAELLGMEG